MKTGKLVIGLIIIAVAIWAFLSLTSPTAQYLGGAILLIIGLALVITSFSKKK